MKKLKKTLLLVQYFRVMMFLVGLLQKIQLFQLWSVLLTWEWSLMKHSLVLKQSYLHLSFPE